MNLLVLLLLEIIISSFVFLLGVTEMPNNRCFQNYVVHFLFTYPTNNLLIWCCSCQWLQTSQIKISLTTYQRRSKLTFHSKLIIFVNLKPLRIRFFRCILSVGVNYNDYELNYMFILKVGNYLNNSVGSHSFLLANNDNKII